jgi:uncharacterized protein YndB with AHSA1/START domain
MIKKILLGLVAAVIVIIAIVLVLAAMRPADYRVERSRSIVAPAAVLFDQVNDHKKFATWNPWQKMDSTSKTVYSGTDSGVGAIASWKGEKVGEGSATIIESEPGELVRQRMEWKAPMEGVSTVDFTFKADGEKTTVTWAMYGQNNFMGKLFSLFMDCESMCGPEFEKGLADLEKIVTATKAN